NTAVKLFSADGSWGFPPVRAGRRLAQQDNLNIQVVFFVVIFSEQDKIKQKNHLKSKEWYSAILIFGRVGRSCFISVLVKRLLVMFGFKCENSKKSNL
ncbi:hypothetical protein NLX67_21530, partial [Domibacillus sp. A3M-37]|uniref:hypothetical protein n=1 Tax=Domibacillus sp. A3M-37 TaxID=2962037 RepID=UPI0020B7D39E